MILIDFAQDSREHQGQNANENLTYINLQE
jgi:hypothetical protein